MIPCNFVNYRLLESILGEISLLRPLRTQVRSIKLSQLFEFKTQTPVQTLCVRYLFWMWVVVTRPGLQVYTGAWQVTLCCIIAIDQEVVFFQTWQRNKRLFNPEFFKEIAAWWSTAVVWNTPLLLITNQCLFNSFYLRYITVKWHICDTGSLHAIWTELNFNSTLAAKMLNN